MGSSYSDAPHGVGSIVEEDRPMSHAPLLLVFTSSLNKNFFSPWECASLVREKIGNGEG